jgi:hypothetical protein
LKVSKELRRMGSEAIHCRSEHRIEQTIEDFDKDHSTAIKSGKKLWWHTTFGEIAVYEQVFRVSGQRFRPFKIYQAQELLTDQANIEGCKLLIGKIDGSMIPIVKVDEESKDKRQNKTLRWQETRLCLVHEAGSTTPTFGATFSCTVADAGKQLYHCAVQAGAW